MSKPWSRPAFPFKNIATSEKNGLFNVVQAPSAYNSGRVTNANQTTRIPGTPVGASQPSTEQDDPMGEEERESGYQADTESARNFVDPRRVHKRVAKGRKPKSYQQKLLHSIIRNYLVVKNLLPQNDDDDNGKGKTTGKSYPIPSLPPSPDLVIVGAYLALQHEGPSIDNILIHWKAPMSHLWNARAIQLLVVDFEVYVQEKQLAKLVELLGDWVVAGSIGKQLDDICSIEELIEHKLTSRRNNLRSLLRKVEVMTATMNATEISAVLGGKNEEAQCRARRKERKKLKFLRRDAIIEEAILLPKNIENCDNAKRWKDIRFFFSHFGVAEMSTDESETEGTFSQAKTLRRVRKYWLSPAASSVLHYVDSQYSPRKLSGALKRGAPPLVRINLAQKVNRTDTPTPEMPVNFYAPEISPAALEVLAPKPAIQIPIVPTIQRADAQVPVD